MSKLSIFRLFSILILGLALFGCSVTQVESEPVELPTLQPTTNVPTPTLAPANEEAPVVVEAAEPPPAAVEPIIEPTGEPVIEPTAVIAPVEPTATAVDVQLNGDMSREEILQWVLTERAAGQTIQQVAADLHAVDLLFDAESNPLYANGGRPYAEVDPEGTGTALWSLSLHRLQDRDTAIREAWLVSTDALVHVQSEEFAESPPLLLYDEDLTGDGKPELMYQQMNCGAHTCSGTYEILSYHHGQLDSVLNSATEYALRLHGAGVWVGISPETPNVLHMSLPKTELVGVEGQTFPGVQMRGGMWSSVGAGIHQGFNQQWGWDGNAVVLINFAFDYTGYRHHELYDGNFAYSLGEKEVATSHYQRVIFDESLNDVYVGDAEVESTRDMAKQIAAFRLLQIRQGWNEQWLAYLQTNYPETPVTAAADMYYAAIRDDQSVADACSQVAQYLESQLAPMGNFSGSLGYGNPIIDATNICQPFISIGEEAQTPNLWTEPIVTGDSMVNSVIEAVLNSDGVALGQLAQPVERPCATDPLPFEIQCAEGEADGTMVPTLLMAHCEGYLVRVTDPTALDFTEQLETVQGLYGVAYDVRSESYAVMFATDIVMGDLTLLVDENGVHTFIWFGCATVGERFSENAQGGVLVAPPEPTGRSPRGY